jgi:hypothetical protein
MAAMMIGGNESGVTWLAPDQLVSTGMTKTKVKSAYNLNSVKGIVRLFELEVRLVLTRSTVICILEDSQFFKTSYRET